MTILGSTFSFSFETDLCAPPSDDEMLQLCEKQQSKPRKRSGQSSIPKPAAIENVKPLPAKPAALADRISLKILVAEDNLVCTARGLTLMTCLLTWLLGVRKINQKLAFRLLNQLGYVPDLAGDGQQAVDAAKKQNYDLILMVRN